ncbi:DUF1616 domain-containing protein [Saliphagus infecundisoli]|uniref:DUF1616 domain-containing protein n=1 Tax=Saliphagus infecundisoli TaxID=1849069 RepID=A0ABD5QKC7_9EURY|nr:DUF1616 domain-containing protein [Saliphagus infecundisoli]
MSFPVRSGTRFGAGWYPGDLAACTVGGLAAGYLVTVLPAGSTLRLAVALPLVFFLPGYALTAALFPASARAGRGWNPVGASEGETDRSRPGGIDTAERLACALALSIATVPTAVIALAPTVGLTTGTVAAALAGVTAVVAQVGVLRRLRVPEGERYTVSARNAFRRLRGEQGAVATASALVLVAGVVAAALALGSGLVAPQPTPGFTELGLYTEEEDGDLVADGFPDAIEPGESVPFVVAVENHEREAANYTVVVEEQRIADGGVADRTRLDEASFAVEDGDSERTEWTVTPTAEEGTVRIAVLLYEGESPASDAEPAEDVHFWLEIADGGDETDADDTDETVEAEDGTNGAGNESNDSGTSGGDDVGTDDGDDASADGESGNDTEDVLEEIFGNGSDDVGDGGE